MHQRWLSEPLRLLLVDDDEADRLFVHRILGEVDPRKLVVIEEAGDYSTGLHLLATRDFDCALVDYQLPDGNAKRLLSELREQSVLRTPIIILTGHDDEDTAVGTLQIGAQDYLVKGRFDGETLLRAIRYAIERFRMAGELERTNAQLKKFAFWDPLTDALNRRGLEHLLTVELARTAREGVALFAVFLDCDDFKNINERHGHAGGDVVLSEIALRIRACVRPSDHVSRIGGDEFIVLLPAVRHSQAMQLAERIRLVVGQDPVAHGATTIPATISVAVFQVPPQTQSITDLLLLAEPAFRRSKRTGKDRVTGEEPAVDLPLSFGPLSVVSQPIIRLADGSHAARELLVRGPHEAIRMPEDLFAHAASKHLTTELDLFCFQKCLAVSLANGAERFHVNLLASTLCPPVVDEVVALLPDRGTSSRYCIEIDVQSIIGNPANLANSVAALRKHGVGIALDQVDFGRASLEAMVVLRPDLVKLGRSLVSGFARDPRLASALGRIVHAARALSVEIVAVGMERDVDVESLRRLGIQYGQGFRWGQPEPMSAAINDVQSPTPSSP